MMHGTLIGLTAMEAYQQPDKILDYTAETSTAGAFRIAQNQKWTAKLAKVSGEGQKQIKNQPDFNDSSFLNLTLQLILYQI